MSNDTRCSPCSRTRRPSRTPTPADGCARSSRSRLDPTGDSRGHCRVFYQVRTQGTRLSLPRRSSLDLSSWVPTRRPLVRSTGSRSNDDGFRLLRPDRLPGFSDVPGPLGVLLGVEVRPRDRRPRRRPTTPPGSRGSGGGPSQRVESHVAPLDVSPDSPVAPYL